QQNENALGEPSKRYLSIFLSIRPKFQGAAPAPLPYWTATSSPCDNAANSSAVRAKITVDVSPDELYRLMGNSVLPIRSISISPPGRNSRLLVRFISTPD